MDDNSYIMSQLPGGRCSSASPSSERRPLCQVFTTNSIVTAPNDNVLVLNQSKSVDDLSTHDNEDNESDGEDEACASQDGKKKSQKTNYACTECRKAHKACSGMRPCDRCVKFGMADSCTSSTRKRRSLTKKYWVDFLQQQQLQQVQQQSTTQKQPIFVDHFEMERMKSVMLKQKSKNRGSIQNWTNETFQFPTSPDSIHRQISPVKENHPGFSTPRPLEPQYSPRVDLQSPRTTPYSTPRLDHSPRLQHTPRSAPYPSPRSSPRYNSVNVNNDNNEQEAMSANAYHSPRLGHNYSPRVAEHNSPRLDQQTHYSPRVEATYSPRMENNYSPRNYPVQYSPRMEAHLAPLPPRRESPLALPSISEELNRLESISELTKNMNIRENDLFIGRPLPTPTQTIYQPQNQLFQGQQQAPSNWRQ